MVDDKKDLTDQQKKFCVEYIFDWNATRAYQECYPDSGYDAARSSASDLLTKPNISKYIAQIQKNLEQQAGISRLQVLVEHKKIALSNIANLHIDWMERKEFDNLSEDQKACISEISTQTRTVLEYNPKSNRKEPIQVEFIKVKLFDKQKALDSVSKMLGYNEASKIDINMPGELKIEVPDKESKEELEKLIKQLNDIDEGN